MLPFLTQKIDVSKQRAADGPVLDIDSAFPVTPADVDAADELAAEQTMRDRRPDGA